jgi:hypothetical protein
MATESSAVVRFINLAQQTQNPVLSTPPAPITSEFGTEVLRTVTTRRASRAPLIVGAIALAGAAAGAGVYLGKSGFGGSSPEKPSPSSNAAAAAAAPVAASDRADVTEPAPAEAPAPSAAQPAAPAPQVTSPIVSVPPDVLAATGYDIRVQPGATITLDGTVLGKAPLRVRNLQPGTHVLDLEAPAGYFSRRMEVAVDAGESKELKVSLDPIEEDPSVAAATAGSHASGTSAKRERAELRRERKEKAREEQERRKEMRATRVAAARAAKQAAKAHRSDARTAMVAEPLPESASKPAAKTANSDKDSQADADLEAAMADIVGKPSKKKSAAAAAGASSLAASEPVSSASGKGTLMLGSKPPCDILVDGRPTGLKTPQRSMELSAGTHEVVLVNADLGIEKKFKVRIAAGKTTKAIQDLTSKLD